MREAANKGPLSVGNRAPAAWTSEASRRRPVSGASNAFNVACERVRKAAVKRDARSGPNQTGPAPAASVSRTDALHSGTTIATSNASPETMVSSKVKKLQQAASR